VAEEDDEAEEGPVEMPEIEEGPGNEIDMAGPKSAAQIKQRACQISGKTKAPIIQGTSGVTQAAELAE
jgi:hypothetical protein